MSLERANNATQAGLELIHEASWCANAITLLMSAEGSRFKYGRNKGMLPDKHYNAIHEALPYYVQQLKRTPLNQGVIQVRRKTSKENIAALLAALNEHREGLRLAADGLGDMAMDELAGVPKTPERSTVLQDMTRLARHVNRLAEPIKLVTGYVFKEPSEETE